MAFNGHIVSKELMQLKNINGTLNNVRSIVLFREYIWVLFINNEELSPMLEVSSNNSSVYW